MWSTGKRCWRSNTQLFPRFPPKSRELFVILSAKRKDMLEATRREANELYTLFRLLEQGSVNRGDAEGKATEPVPVVAIYRKEHDGMRSYIIEDQEVHVVGDQMDERFPREDFAGAADWLLARLKESGDEVDISDMEGFLDALKIYDMEAQTDDRTDMHLRLWSLEGGPKVGIRIQSRLCGLLPLIDGGRTANIKLEQTGIRFSQPAVHKINWTEQPENVAEVARRILYIEGLGGVLKYADVADKVFRSNLLLIDTNLPRIIATMLRALHIDGIARVEDLIGVLEEKNPLKVKDELVQKHGIYRYKVRELLLAAAWGMRPSKQYTGREGAIGGYVFTDQQGAMLLYTRAEEQAFADYLVAHTRLEKSLPDDDKYGYLERENGKYYLKLNLKVGFRR